ncbi:hypothetical protein GBK2_61 [Geobacillus phage GBK2]|uniref:hypothetical protein n=1 Tax=Geobacillus phage GBK2 TaxID=1458842 RepID=UPI0003F1D23B|nr:hypothetical protein GBK2_61 [Geobacillus phage GBK2]AHJ88659.1 hypothetical protein GBK2_61 [Geobacillus phage GBK2]
MATDSRTAQKALWFSPVTIALFLIQQETAPWPKFQERRDIGTWLKSALIAIN